MYPIGKNLTNIPNNPLITKSLNNENNNLYDLQKHFSYSTNLNPFESQRRIIKTNINVNSQKKPKYNNYINNNLNNNPLLATPNQPSSQRVNTNIYTNAKEKEEFDRTQKYINYLKEHLNSSYYANNEINNKNSIYLERTKSLKEEIQNNNILYEKLKNSIEEKINQNNEYNKKYEIFLNQQKNKKNDTDNINLNLEEKIKELKQKNLILNKENQSKEEIILNLNRTLEILEKSKLDKNKEKTNKIKELNEEKELILKLKANIEKITKELYTKNIKLEEKKKSMIYLLNNKNSNNNVNKNIIRDNFSEESNELLNKEIEKMETIIDNQKLLLNKIKENQKEIKDRINEEKMNIGNDGDNNYKKLILEEKLKNKELTAILIKSKNEAKELTKVHNDIKDKYELEINKLKEQIELLLKNKKFQNENENSNLDIDEALGQVLEEQKNLKMFNKEFKEKLILKKALEDKIELMQKENEKLKSILNSTKSNNIQLKGKPNNINNIEIDEKEEDNNSIENKENNIIQDNQIKINLDGNIKNKDSSIFTITDKGKLFTYNIIKKKFTTVNTNNIDGWQKFIEIFLSNYEGSLLLNTFEGLYILTGENFNDLYYYSQHNNSISEIITFNYGHKYGGLILTPEKKQLIALGGVNSKEVEMLNLEENTIEELPNLLTERVNSSYSFIEDKLLYAFLGENNNSIEYLNLNEEEKEWKNVEFTNNGIENIFGHISIPVNDNEILIVGGKNNNKMILFNVNEKYLEITDNKIPFLDTVGEYLFDKDKNYNKIMNIDNKRDENGNEINQLVCMDSKGNVHLFDNDFTYIVLLVYIYKI